MGGISAIAAVAVLGDGSLAAADVEPDQPQAPDPPPRPRIVAVVGDSVAPELEVPIANRLRGPVRRFTAARLFDGATDLLGADPRETEPARVIGLVEPVPLLLIHGDADTTVPLSPRVVGWPPSAVPHAEQWVVAGADHSAGHAVAAQDYERRVSDFLRMAFTSARDGGCRAGCRTASWARDMIGAPGSASDGSTDPSPPARPAED